MVLPESVPIGYRREGAGLPVMGYSPVAPWERYAKSAWDSSLPSRFASCHLLVLVASTLIHY
jgi:hypothetical protein